MMRKAAKKKNNDITWVYILQNCEFEKKIHRHIMNKVGIIGVFCRIFTHDEIVQKVVAGLQKCHIHYPKQLTTS